MKYEVIKKNNRFYFLMDEKPCLLLGGEVHNSAASTVISMEKNIWPFVNNLGLNTLLVPVYWENIETSPGVFNFDLIEAQLQKAAENKIKLVFLWFGLWKNGLSTYVPSWIKTDTENYFRVVNQKQEQLNCISPFCTKAIEADCRALSSLCQFISQHPLKDQLCMMQIQNEVGCLETARDHSRKAQQIYGSTLPEKIRELYPRVKNWQELPEETFMAYAFSHALEKMAIEAKRWLDIPLFTNAWLHKEGKHAGDYPSGGPTKNVLNVWAKNAPSLTAFAPDIYEENVREIIQDYQMIDQPLFIPETRKDLSYLSNCFYAFGQGALLYSPFGIEDLRKSTEAIIDEDQAFLKQLGLDQAAFDPTGSLPYFTKCYQIIKELTPFLTDETLKIHSFKKEKDTTYQYQDENYRFLIKYLSKDKKEQLNTAGLFFQLENDYFFAGCNFALFHEAVDEELRSEILNFEEGYFEGKKWITERVLNGDERYTPYIGNMPKIIKFSLYTYPKKEQEVVHEYLADERNL